MPAYSYQEQFIPFLLDESKDHTVRKERAGRSRHARPGETIYHYFGMRTKWCRKIGESICSRVVEILITKDTIFLAESGSIDAAWPLTPYSANRFAWGDGFRPAGSTGYHPEGAFELMLQFFKQTHELPFHGVVIYWKDFRPAK